MKNVLALVGGISRNSINRKLFGFVRGLNKGRFAFDAPEIGELPFFSQDIEDNPPEKAADFQRRVEAAEAVLIVTPEYNRSFPGVLKNALDWGSRPDDRWYGKPAALMGASIGDIGTFGAQQHLRLVLSFLGLRTMPDEYYMNFTKRVGEDGALLPKAAEHLDEHLEAFRKWIGE